MGKIKRRRAQQAAREARDQPPRSRLNHPVKEWTGDLPDRAEDCGSPPKLIWVNELNDVWMELPRYVNHGWGRGWFAAIITSTCFLYFFFSLNIMSDMLADISSFLFSVVTFLPLGLFCLFIVRTVLFEPRGAPVRFNRKRQKVYVYEFQKSVWPWKRWRPVIKVFDWKDIHGEWVMRRAHADWGHRIYCAVCKPGTFDVRDRFILTWTVGGIDEAGGLWSFCRHYMEKKPVPTAPLYRDKPR
ncbi:DUF6708 domain-containing protein, partial [uncultured Cedecea sp.]|uniref:DUF6708 domain-containing protein n=1 Tax=uncultured Cedecea sp. TaxID=988762 RepID=UPI00260CA78D